jgi:hypothetical protein
MPPVTHHAIWFARDYVGGWVASLLVITLLAVLALLQFIWGWPI